MRRLSLLDLHKAELKKNMLSKIKGGIEVRCICSVNNPVITTRESGGSISNMCACSDGAAMSGVQDRPIK